MPTSDTLTWLVSDYLVDAEHVEANNAWQLRFQSGATLSIECLWRKLENEAVTCTSEDHGHQFGLAAPLDAEAVLKSLARLQVTAVSVRSDTADISLRFGESACLEVISSSAGYEAWSATHPQLGTIVAGSGGRIIVFR
jgi:hypothetical protein